MTPEVAGRGGVERAVGGTGSFEAQALVRVECRGSESAGCLLGCRLLAAEEVSGLYRQPEQEQEQKQRQAAAVQRRRCSGGGERCSGGNGRAERVVALWRTHPPHSGGRLYRSRRRMAGIDMAGIDAGACQTHAEVEWGR